MAYQDDFRNKVLAALKAKNLAVDISQEATQQAIVQEAQNLAKSEAKTMSAADMKQVLEDVAKELSNEKQQFSAQSSDFIAFKDQLAGDGPTGPGGSYSGGGIAVSVANKDIMIIPANGGLGAAGSATSVNSLSQIDFKHIANPLAYGVNDPNEVKSSLFNWAERITGTPFDTPVLGLGGAWGGVSYAPTPQWGIGGSQGSGVGGSINTDKGFGQIIYFKPATSTIYASLFNDLGLDTSYTNRTITITNYRPASPGAFPTAGFAVTFGGIGNSGDLVFHGAIDEAQTNTIKFLSPLTISNSTAANTLTLGLSSATSTVQNFVGGGTAQYTLSTTTSSFAQGDLFYASGTGHVTLTKLAIGGNNTFLTSNGSIPSWTSSISANTVSITAATGSTILYPIMNNSTNSGVALSYDVDFNVDPSANILRYSSGSFYVGTAVSSPIFTSVGDVDIRPGANSINGVQITKLTGQAILNADTTNGRVSIGDAVGNPAYTLDVAGDTNISTGSVFRINGTSVLSNNTLGSTVTVSSLTQVGTIATGSWAATAITAHYGGTGLQTPFAVGDLLFANTATTWSRLADVATGSVLASGGVGVAPAYVLTNTLSVGTAVTANNLNVVNATTAGPHFLHFSPTATGTGIATSSNLTISFNPATFILSTSGLAVTATTATTTTTSGALIVSGGMGLAGNAFIGGTVYVPSSTASNFSNLLVSNTTATTSTTSGALIVSGGMGLAGNAFIGGTAYVPSTTPSNFSNLLVSNNTATTSTTSGALVVNGGLGLAGNAFIGSTVYVPSSTPSNFSNLLVSNSTATTSTTSGALVVSGGLGLAGNAFIGSTVYVPSSTPSNFSNLLVSNNTATTSTSSGALVVSGGLGLAGNAFIGGTINVPSTSTSNISNVTFANGIVTAGVWQGTAVGTTYGGTGSNLSPSGGVGNSNRIYVTGGSGQYATTLIDNATSGNLLVSGGPLAAPTFTNTTNGAFSFASGTLTINNAAITTGTITGVPTNANDIVNKTYADSISAGLDIHDSARLTTISAIGGSYRQSGAAGTLSGQGDYIIATTPGALIGLDAGWDTPTSGIALTNGQRVLIKDGVLGGYASGTGAFGAYPTTYGGFSSSWVANGIYEVVSYGGAATSGWLLVRATDSDNQAGFQELTGGTFTFVEEGTLYADNAFVCSNDTQLRGPIGFGATQISWTPFSGGAALTMGQGLTKVGNTLATNFKLLQVSSVNANLSNGFSVGGERTGSVGSSSYATWVVTGSAALSTNTLTANTTGFSLAGGQTNTTLTVAGVAAANTLTGAADGFTLAGGTTGRTLTVIGGNITVANGVFNGAGFGLTLSSSGNLNLNNQTLAIGAGSANITFTPSSTTATTYNLVSSGTAQNVLSTADTTFTAGDLYYGGGASFAALSRLAFGSGTGNSVLIRGANAPAWGTIALANSNFVSGVLAISNGGTNNGSLSVTNGQVVYTDGSKLAATAVGTADQFLKSAGSGAPVWSAITLSNTTSVTGTLGISNGGTNATATPTNGGVSYGTGTAYAFTGAGTANSVLLSTGAGAPIWGAVVLSSSASVTGTLPVTNGGMGAASFTLNGILYGNGSSAIQVTGAAASSVLVTNGSNVPSLSTDIPTAVTIGTAYIYRVGGTDVAIADGGTNTNATPTSGAVAYGTGTAYAFTNAGTAGSVLISNGTNPLFSAINLASSNAVTGVLPIANGGSNATAANFTANGVVIYDSANTRLASATGLTMTGGTGLSVTGTVASSGGFFIGSNSVISSLTVTGAIYGAVTLNSAASVGGTSFLSQSGNTITLNFPGTGITGGGSANQVPYYNAARELTGNVGLVYNPTAATGVGLSVNINNTTGTILQVNSAQTMTSGLLMDVDNNGSQRYTIDWKGMATHTVGSGNTGLIVSGGRTILSAATANYATINLPSSAATNPGVGNTQIGDLWFNGTNLYFRRDANTSFDLLVGSVSGSGTANRIAKWSTSSALTDSNLSESASGVGMTITSTSSIAAGGGTTALLTLQTIVGDNSAIDRYFVRGVTSTGTRLFSIDTSGNLRATTKSFDIPHPTKEGVRLVYGVLEGPEHGVYHRGTVEGNGVIQINLPEYWHKLVGDQYTIQLTPWGNYNVCINSKTENYFTIQLVGDFISRKFKNIKVDYIVHGSRLDAPLETEQ